MDNTHENNREHDTIKVGDLVRKREGNDWGIVTGICETPSIVDNRILTVFFTTAAMEIPIRARYMTLVQRG
tara:strand:- start:77 stop:289 length:213 start_codon:yes stop_codon:yes gene_type:complete